MLWRISSFLLCQLAGGIGGWWLAADRGAELGLVAGGVAWFLLDLVRGLRMLQWLRGGGRSEAPVGAGLWGELAERTRRALRARDQLAEDAETRLQDFLAAIQASPNGVILLDVDGRIEWCNQTAAEHLGIDPQRDVQQLIGNLVRDPAFAAYTAQGDYSRDVIILSRDSSPGRLLKLAVHLHPYGQGRKLLLSRDVTAREQAETMRRDFIANVSHEIRTPLTVLAGFIETLQNLPLAEDERRRYLELMAQQGHRMQTLVRDLLTLSRLEGSPLPGIGEWTPVPALMAECEQEGRSLSTLLGKSQELRFAGGAGQEIAGAPSELLSAMSNLVSNAVRYTPANGRIEVRWSALPDGRAELSVRDTGPGIAAEHLPRITERFYRVDRSRSRETGGTGLGLAIVKHVLQRHGAELRIDSTPGAGSTFAIVFPAARLRAVMRGPDGESARPATAAP
ncbi:MAG TPA: phosphate regulon sensor histidine kinase PhoR [Ramlibacter sp.]|jgi:two-component system phosphate regulon sensor histidine kinase PhoR|uniref:phosphate regulon sensor histidine kinase PhoR n=1 Tax=Ramlibacter sp. TaxID=1917967 RepID=UPI002D35466A|nr:phosphate regulon sensor histidine kinase PhoR [Ramlibacter sp.]HZY18230.1 phosphate regulon sensor histidine kinase PhoR [Ramlibacter sp.]